MRITMATSNTGDLSSRILNLDLSDDTACTFVSDGISVRFSTESCTGGRVLSDGISVRFSTESRPGGH